MEIIGSYTTFQIFRRSDLKLATSKDGTDFKDFTLQCWPLSDLEPAFLIF